MISVRQDLYFPWVGVVALTLVASVAHGEDTTPESTTNLETETHEEMVVYGRRVRRGLDVDQSDAAFVITREEIKATQMSALVDVLRNRPGITVQSAGGPGKQTDLRIRGSEANQVQVIIDGVRVGSATNGSFNWANLPADAIERVEIIRGPQSTLFGANAVGGVILIETREGSEATRVEMSGGYGSDEQSLVSGHVSGETDWDGRYSVSVVRTTIDGVSATTRPALGATDVEDDPYRNIHAVGRFSVPIGAGKLRAGARYSDSFANLDNSTRDNPNFEQETQEQQIDLGFDYPVSANWTTRFVVARYALEREGTDVAVSFNNFKVETTSYQASWLNEVDLFGGTLLGGVDFETESGKNRDFGVDQSVEQTAFFAKVETPHAWPVGLNGGFRFESNSISNDQVTYQLGLSARLAELHPFLEALDGLEFRANYGTGYRPPTLNELFFEDSFSIPNPLLRPERSEGVDAGFHYVKTLECELGIAFDFWGFYQRYENLIQFQTVSVFPVFRIQAVNVARAKIWGLEGNAEFDWRWLRIGASWTHIDSEDSDGFRLRRRPLDSGRVSVGAEHERVGANVSVRAVAQSYSRSQQRDQTGAFVLVDLNTHIDVFDGVTLRANVHNVFDEEYEEIFRRGTLGRTFFASLEIEL